MIVHSELIIVFICLGHTKQKGSTFNTEIIVNFKQMTNDLELQMIF